MFIGFTGTIRIVMSAAGPSGLRAKVVSHLSRNDLKLPNDVNQQRHYLTCTIVKESQIFVNVTVNLIKEK